LIFNPFGASDNQTVVDDLVDDLDLDLDLDSPVRREVGRGGLGSGMLDLNSEVDGVGSLGGHGLRLDESEARPEIRISSSFSSSFSEDAHCSPSMQESHPFGFFQ